MCPSQHDNMSNPLHFISTSSGEVGQPCVSPGEPRHRRLFIYIYINYLVHIYIYILLYTYKLYVYISFSHLSVQKPCELTCSTNSRCLGIQPSTVGLLGVSPAHLTNTLKLEIFTKDTSRYEMSKESHVIIIYPPEN